MARVDGVSLPRSTPRAQGVDARGVDAFVSALDGTPDVELHSLALVRGDHLVAEGWWAPYGRDRVHLLYSLSKSFTSAALGFALDEGLLDLDDTLLQHLPHLAEGLPDGPAHDPVLRHLASMASGHTWDTWADAVARDRAEPLRGFLALAPDGTPGTTFAYNQSCTYAVATVVQHLAGTTLTEYLRPRLLDPLGVGEVWWQQHPRGRDLGFTGLHARTEDLARFGQTLLRDGRFDGRQVLPAGWVEAASRPHVETAGEENPDWAQGYGYQFWTARHGYRGDGAYGQFVVVLPEQDAVLAVTGQSEDMQAVLDAAWEHLLPALGASLPDDAAAHDDALAARLAGLALPVEQGRATPDDETAWGSVRFTPHAGGERVPRGLRRVQVDRVDDAWVLRVHEGDDVLSAELGTDGWRTTEDASTAALVPVATTAAWQPDGMLRVRLAFLEAPHGLRLVLDPRDGSADVRWTTEPLRGDTVTTCAAPR
ncbi:hypothetical protein GCM10028777_22950 [Angustibacter speluncae]